MVSIVVHENEDDILSKSSLLVTNFAFEVWARQELVAVSLQVRQAETEREREKRRTHSPLDSD